MLVLVHFGGPSDNGLRCHRFPAESVCVIGRTTFFGLFSNSEFAVPESVDSCCEEQLRDRTTWAAGGARFLQCLPDAEIPVKPATFWC